MHAEGDGSASDRTASRTQAATALDDEAVRATAQTKRDSISRLQDSALQVFSSKGFDGTSLRNIADHAGVPLSTINRYFGSKLDLFNEIEHRIWHDVNRDREELFRKPLFADAAGRPTLRSVLHAFVFPVVRLAVGEEANLPVLRFLREFVARKYHERETSSFLKVAERWITALMEARPDLPRARAVWALGFLVNVTFSDQMQHGSYDPLMPPGARMDASELTAMIIDFCEAGINAIVPTLTTAAVD